MAQSIFTLNVVFILVVAVCQCYGFSHSIRRRQACSHLQFQCQSGECVDQFLVCDGEKNCKDGSDEMSSVCKDVRCPSFAFRCDYGACVDADSKCNGVMNCADNSDEKDCLATSNNSCKGKEFQCKSGICIDPFLLCDGIEDCDDGSDEISEVCSGFRCPGFAFRCDYGGCIDKDGFCNGIVQCADKSDEKPEKCGTTTIKPTTQAPSESEGCILPAQPENGNYAMPGCDAPCQPPPSGSRVHATFLNYSCKSGFVLSGSQYVVCKNGWSAAFPTCSRVSCTPLENPSREFECKLNDKNVECNKPMAPGTKVNVKCAAYYGHAQEFSNFNTICNPSGKWSRDVTPCIPTCGEQNPEGLPFIANGVPAKLGEFPWHAGIYRPINGVLSQSCGGSVISDRHIVTASHCFWDEENNKKFDIKDFRVVVGKYFIDWEKTTKYLQIPEIENVILHPRYKGRARFYENDIAVIVLKKSVEMSDAVRPVCIDLDQKYTNKFSAGKSGIVVGWGITHTMKQSEVLHTTTLPYVSTETCEQGVPKTFQVFLTYDKFCAGYQNGTSVCRGDSGGGYATKFLDGKWYLMGIVSVGVPSVNADECNTMQYTTFTKVLQHYEFIKKEAF